jgi:hypothetical protein
MGGMTRGGEAPVTGSSPPQRRQQILLAVVAAALLIVAIDGWIFLHFGANAATRQYPDNYLTAIACPNATQCWAVGQTASAPGGNTLSEGRGPLLKLETAGHWRTVAVRGRGARRGALEAIACPGASDCWAVGGSSAQGSALVEHWTGGTWQPVPSPALPGAQLDAVSCASASACWAIGGTQSRTGAAGDVLERWNGSQWNLAGTLPGGLQPREISCPAAGHCLALGLRNGVAAAAAYSGGRWTAAPAPAPAPTAGGAAAPTAAGSVPSLFGCASRTVCLAAFPGRKPVTDVWNGRSWTQVATALPTYPVALRCSASDGCWLLGMTGKSRPLALRWQVTDWVAVAVRAPHRGYLDALACGDRCWAVGGTGGARENGAPYTTPLITALP